MDVSCPACAAKYTADEEKLRGKTARMRCKACNTAWMVSGPGASAAPAASVPPASGASADAEAKRAKTGSDREKRDLFAARAPDDINGSVQEKKGAPSQAKDTLLPPPAYGFSSGTGSRNENSVLFRVDQLASNGVGIKTPEPESLEALGKAKTQMAMSTPTRIGHGSGNGDEEGVIDLNSLASVPPPGKRSIVPVAPLFSEPPPLAFDSSGPSASRPAIAKPISKGKLFGAIAAAAAFLVVAGLGISVAFKGEEPVKHAAAANAAPPTPTPAPTAETKPAEPPAEKTASNDDDGSKKAKKGKRKGGGKAGGTSTAAAPQTKKAADPCGCKGDFNCILACTAKNGH